MSKRAKVMVRHKSAVNPQTSIPEERKQRRTSSSASSLAEMAGGTTAGVAAVACCAPYGVANLVVLAAYKVPAGLCKKAIRERRRRKLVKNGVLHTRSLSQGDELFSSDAVVPWAEEEAEMGAISEEEYMDLEKEMWDHFSGAGFWRTPELKDT